MKTSTDDIDTIRNAITACMRALAQKPQWQPTCPPITSKKNLNQRRGLADRQAIKHRYHDPAIHREFMPEDPRARTIFDHAEQARIESCAALDFPGVKKNLHALYKTENPDQAIYSFLLKSWGMQHPATPKFSVHPQWDELIPHQKNQKEFAQTLHHILKNLTDPATPEEEQTQTTPPENGDEEQTADENQPSMNAANMAEFLSGDIQQVEIGDEIQKTENTNPQDVPWPGRHHNQTPYPAAKPYKIFTTQFDETIPAHRLASNEERTQLRQQLNRQISNTPHLVMQLANRLQRLLMAQQRRFWVFDQEEGELDTARLSRIITDPTHPLRYKQEHQTPFRDTVISLLIDNSGSMRGRPITIAALCADILARTLERCGVKVEILGFTTINWKGGKSRMFWQEQKQPAYPGRLNDIRHIIYKSADAPYRQAQKNIGVMLREGLLKENIDGEALIWAHQRLLARTENRKILMVISDGAPVDDSTLATNPGNYLEHHLQQTIAQIEKKSPVELLAIGIGHDVGRYYKNAITIADVEELGVVLLNQLTDLFQPQAA